MPSVAVLIPTHNHGELLRHSVRSVLWQTLKPSEILIVGDGATVATREVALDLAKNSSRIRFYDFPKGARLGEPNRNTVLGDVNADIVCYLGDDDLWFPNHVETVAGLLTFADFASSLDLSVEPDQTITAGLVDLSKGYYRRTIHRQRVPLSAVAHTLESFRRLPFRWRTAPKDIPTDRWMWMQFARQRWVRMVSGGMPTVLRFPSYSRQGFSIEQRIEEMNRWEGLLTYPAGREELLMETIFLFRRCSLRPAVQRLDWLINPKLVAQIFRLSAWKRMLGRRLI